MKLVDTDYTPINTIITLYERNYKKITFFEFDGSSGNLLLYKIKRKCYMFWDYKIAYKNKA